MRARSLRTALARFVLRTFDEGDGFTHFLFAGDVARLEALADVTRVATGVIAPATSFDAHQPLLAMAEEAFPRIRERARAIAGDVTLAPPMFPDFEDVVSIVTDDPYWEGGRRPVLVDASDVFLVALLDCLDNEIEDRGAGAIARSDAARAARRLSLAHGFASADGAIRADDGPARPSVQLALRRFAMATYGDDGAVSLLVDAEIPE